MSHYNVPETNPVKHVTYAEALNSSNLLLSLQQREKVSNFASYPDIEANMILAIKAMASLLIVDSIIIGITLYLEVPGLKSICSVHEYDHIY